MSNSAESLAEKDLPCLPDELSSSSQKLRQRIRQICIHLWIWELLSLVVSASCVGVVLIILLRYDGQPLPKWPYGLTINGVISVLAGVSKASMILPVAECISQLKWHWFWDRRARPIIDFEYFDVASRGPWGCLVLLCRPRQWGPVTVGAAITVLALLMEPSLQFIPSYPSRLTAGGHAKLPRSTFYSDVKYGIEPDSYSYGDMITTQKLGMTTKSAVYRRLYDLNDDSGPAIAPTCPTSNCTWPNFSSLAVCSHCTDLSDGVYENTNPSASEWWTSNGASMDDMLWFKTDNHPDTVAYNQTSKQALLDMTFMYHNLLPNGTLNKPNAAECILYFCVQHYSAEMAAGVYAERLLSSWPGPSEPVPDAPDWLPLNETVPISLRTSNLTLRAPGEQTNYSVDGMTFHTLSTWMSDVMGNAGVSGIGDESEGSVDSIPGAMYAIQTERSANATTTGPERVMAAAASSLTAAIRQMGNDSMWVDGQSLREEVYIKARWWWAILPLALVLLTVSFMIATLLITVQRGVPIWKSSALATLAHGLNEDSAQLVTAARLDTIENKARGYKMLMGARKQQWRLVATGS